MELKVGARWRSTRCATQIIVVRAPSSAVSLECGGSPMVPVADATPLSDPPDPELAAGSLIGKRYRDDELGIEVLCTRPGSGTLAIGGTPLPMADAKPLPSSD